MQFLEDSKEDLADEAVQLGPVTFDDVAFVCVTILQQHFKP